MLCREPMPRAGGHYPDQAERAHRGPAQSRRHRQHHHAGRHSLRNELLYRPVDTAQEVQTHHQHLLRLSTSCSKSHQCFPLTQQHVYTNKEVYLHTYLGQNGARSRWDYQGENGPPFISAPLKRRTPRGTFLYFCLVPFYIVSVYTSPSIPEWHPDQRKWVSGETSSHKRHCLFSAEEHVMWNKKSCVSYFSVWMWHSQLIFGTRE